MAIVEVLAPQYLGTHQELVEGVDAHDASQSII